MCGFTITARKILFNFRRNYLPKIANSLFSGYYVEMHQKFINLMTILFPIIYSAALTYLVWKAFKVMSNGWGLASTQKILITQI